MTKAIRSTILLLMLAMLANGQSENHQPILLGSFGASDEDVLNSISILEGRLVQANFNPNESFLVLRVCSNDPMLVALSMSKSEPFLTTSMLEKHGIPKSSVIYLRQNKTCKPLLKNYASTDFWIVPKSAELPEFIEARKASNISGNQLTRAGFLQEEKLVKAISSGMVSLTPQSYKAVIEKIVDFLESSKSAVVVIRVPFYRFSSAVELNRNVRETQRYLRGRGIAQHRIYVKKIYSGSSFAPEDEPKYPDVLVVREN